MKAFCPNCQRIKEIEKVRRKHLYDNKRTQSVFKCVDCGYVARVKQSKKNPILNDTEEYTRKILAKSKLPKGVLISKYAKKNGITYAQASAILKNPVLKGGVQKLSTGEYKGVLLNDRGWIAHEHTGPSKDLVENNLRTWANKHGHTTMFMNPKKNYPKKLASQTFKHNGPVKKNGKTIIYNRILAIQAEKGDKSLWPLQHFEHKFTGKDAEVLGNPDGSITVKSKSGKKLWKNINYSKRDIK